ncbi:MAG TPA: DUF3520 domain-containing protein, partial [Saprospiraceae bacterium]|nr:DUF3520 domain-containing protein [Saprospiraceae bacterium]
LLHLAIKAKEIDRENIPSSNLVFLIDVSGSMNMPNRLPLVIESFKLLINQLSKHDVVSIVTYAGTEKVVAKGIYGHQKERLYQALEELQAGGSTAGGAGIKKAYEIGKEYYIEGGNNRVILATDGDFNVGVSSEGALVRLIEEKRKTGIYLSILGYGMGNYQESKMQELSKAGNGNHFYIDNLDEAKKCLINEFGGTLYTVANDVKFQVEFNPSLVSGYRVLGYENRQMANTDFNDDTKDAGELGAGHVVTVLFEIIPLGAQSKYISSTDTLKYSTRQEANNVNLQELATIKARYKSDLQSASIKVERPITTAIDSWDKLSSAVKWSTIVAEFGLLLRDSPYKASSDYVTLIQRAKRLAQDEHQKECVKLIEKAYKLNINKAAQELSEIE